MSYARSRYWSDPSDDKLHIHASLWDRRQRQSLMLSIAVREATKITSAATAEAQPKKYSPTMTAISTTVPRWRRIRRLCTIKKKSILHKWPFYTLLELKHSTLTNTWQRWDYCDYSHTKTWNQISMVDESLIQWHIHMISFLVLIDAFNNSFNTSVVTEA